jgi:predicted aconitase
MPKLISVLKAVSAASQEIGIAQRDLSQAVGSADEDVRQMVALLSAVADELLLEEPYQDTLGDGHWIISADGQTYKSEPNVDTDLILFDGRLAISGLKYRFLHGKGLEYAEHLRDFANRMAKVATRANNRVLDLDEEWSRVV